MKPKSELQKLVVSLSVKLPKITKVQTDFALQKGFEKYVVISRKTLYCLECGHSWKPGHSSLVTSVAGETCPNCNTNLKLYNAYYRGMKESIYYAILTTMDNMQVIRMFFVTKYTRKKFHAEGFVSEVMQHWIDDSGKITSIAQQVNAMSFQYDQWIGGSPLEVRTNTSNTRARNNINPHLIYPSRRILPILKRNGFNGFFYRFAPQQLFKLILSFPQAETLMKSHQIKLLEHSYLKPESILHYWPSIRIAIRNNYIVNDPSNWMDLLGLLTYFRKDILNPKFVCPDNLMLSHDYLMKKKQKIVDEQKHKEAIAKAISDQQLYEAAKTKFFDLVFSKGNISITPLKSIKEFYEEGSFLKHCIYTNEYYNRENSLLLSAKINNIPTETVEISLSKMMVVQSRGKCNQTTKYHNSIVNLVNKNLNAVAKCL